ncbi:MAG: hypothetical protein ACAI43_11680, partial [Phycisphaerae bacterium]
MLIACVAWLAFAPSGGAAILDDVSFADAASERVHRVVATRGETIAGLLSVPARRLLPTDPPTWEGGRIAFELKVDPARPTYFTLRLSGSDVSRNRLMLYADGKQVGYRHLGDYDALDVGADAPVCAGRFYYVTQPLPESLTKGKDRLTFEIRASGPVSAYARTFDEYQKVMTEPSRGVYRAYTHTEGCFVPPADDRQGAAPPELPARIEPGAEVITDVKRR